MTAPIDVTLTIRPVLLARIDGSTSRMSANGPKKLVSNWSRMTCSGISSAGPER